MPNNKQDDRPLGTCDRDENPHTEMLAGTCQNWKPLQPAPTPQATVWPHPIAPATEAEIAQAVTDFHNRTLDEDECMAYVINNLFSRRNSPPKVAEYSATCTICGGMAKPGGKCLSCGEQAPAPLTEEQLCAGDREMFAAIEPQAQEAAQPEPELPPHGVDTSWNNGFQGEELQKEILKARERQLLELLEALRTIAQQLVQELVQIKSAKSERPKVVTYPAHGIGLIAFYKCEDVNPLLDSRDQTISALRLEVTRLESNCNALNAKLVKAVLDNAAKNARITELEALEQIKQQ
jgi:hypothetical protein